MNTTIRSSRRIAACLTLLSLCGAEIAFAQCDPVRVMPLGDSITAGFSSGLGDTSLLVGYRKMLYDDLIGSMRWVDFVGGESFGWHVASFDADNEGHGGFTNEDVSLRVYQWLSSNPADYVLLHVGTNYQTVSRDIANLDIILDEIDRYETDTGSSVTVVVAQIIPNGEYSSETEYNQQVASLVTQRIGAGDRLVLVDMESALIFPDDFSDNLHPNASGYAKMAEVWRPVLESLIAPCPVPDSTPPDQPDGLQATPAGSDGVSLRWNASNDVGSTGWVGYRLYRDGVQIATTSHLDYSDSGLSPGMSYIYTLEAYDSVGNISAMSSPASVTTIGTDPTALRINAGGGDYTDTLGRLWQADFGFDTGHAALFSSSQVAGTAEDLLYRSVRWDDGTVPELGYRLALAPGVYQVSLHFMEGFVSGPGQRVFGVDLEGVRTWSGLDVYAEAGGRDVALVKTATVTVQDGQLDIGFVHGVENPMVSAIEVVEVPGP